MASGTPKAATTKLLGVPGAGSYVIVTVCLRYIEKEST